MALIVIESYVHTYTHPDIAGGNYAFPVKRMAFIVEPRASKADLRHLKAAVPAERKRRRWL